MPIVRTRTAAAILLIAALPLTAAQEDDELPAMYGNNEMHQFKKAKPAPMNADVPYLRCPVCQKLATQALKEVSALAAEEKPAPAKKRRFESSSRMGNLEEATEDLLARMCNPDNDGAKRYNKPTKNNAGAWIAEYDVKKDGDALVLEQKGAGHCRRECRTIAKACEDVIEKLTEDEDADVAAYLVKAAKEQLSAGTVSQRLCTKMAGVCKKGKVPKWPSGKARMNEQFKIKDAEDLRLEKMAATMPGEHGTGITLMKPGDYDLGGENKVDDIDMLKEEL